MIIPCRPSSGSGRTSSSETRRLRRGSGNVGRIQDGLSTAAACFLTGRRPAPEEFACEAYLVRRQRLTHLSTWVRSARQVFAQRLPGSSSPWTTNAFSAETSSIIFSNECRPAWAEKSNCFFRIRPRISFPVAGSITYPSLHRSCRWCLRPGSGGRIELAGSMWSLWRYACMAPLSIPAVVTMTEGSDIALSRSPLFPISSLRR